MKFLTLLMTVALVAPMPAVAGSAEDQKVAAGKSGDDPDKIVCERQEVLGSRLGGKRVCKTKSQWAEERRLAREQVDRSQVRNCSNGSGGC